MGAWAVPTLICICISDLTSSMMIIICFGGESHDCFCIVRIFDDLNGFVIGGS